MIVVVGLVIGLVVSYSIAKPSKQLKLVADKFTDGDFSAELPPVRSNDEVSELTVSLEMLIMALKTKMQK
jgi:nitrogen fixation/metabolism regulation signal transduction histidine kinase